MEKAEFQTGFWNDRICRGFFTSEITGRKSKNWHIRGKLCASRSFKICICSHTGARGLVGSFCNCFLFPSNSTAANGFGKSRWYISVNISKIYVNCTDNNCLPWKPQPSLARRTHICVAPTLPRAPWHHLFILFQFWSPLDPEASLLSHQLRCWWAAFWRCNLSITSAAATAGFFHQWMRLSSQNR